MPLSKCPRTGKLFDNSLGAVHPSVKEEEERDYEKLLDYINEHPHCAPVEVVEATGVSLDCLNRLTAQGRIKKMTEDEAEEFMTEQEKKAQEQAEFNRRLQQQIVQTGKSVTVTDTGAASVRSALEEKRRR